MEKNRTTHLELLHRGSQTTPPSVENYWTEHGRVRYSMSGSWVPFMEELDFRYFIKDNNPLKIHDFCRNSNSVAKPSKSRTKVVPKPYFDTIKICRKKTKLIVSLVNRFLKTPSRFIVMSFLK